MSVICNFILSFDSKFESETDGQIRPWYYVLILCFFLLFFITLSDLSKQHENYLTHVSKSDKCDFCLRAALDRTVSSITIQRLSFYKPSMLYLKRCASMNLLHVKRRRLKCITNLTQQMADMSYIMELVFLAV